MASLEACIKDALNIHVVNVITQLDCMVKNIGISERKRQRRSKNLGLFNDAVSNSGYSQSNGRMPKEYRNKNYVDLVVA